MDPWEETTLRMLPGLGWGQGAGGRTQITPCDPRKRGDGWAPMQKAPSAPGPLVLNLKKEIQSPSEDEA